MGINDILLDDGQFTCLLGGRSSGKSLVIKRLLDDNDYPMIFMTMRLDSGNILQGLKSVLRSKTNLRNLVYFLDEDLSNPERKAETIIMLRKFYTSCVACTTMGSFLGEIEDFYKGCVTLILDEADAAFTITEYTTAAELKEMKELLGLLKILTKETRMVQYINKHLLLFMIYFFLSFFFIIRILFQISKICCYFKMFYSILKHLILMYYTLILYSIAVECDLCIKRLLLIGSTW